MVRSDAGADLTVIDGNQSGSVLNFDSDEMEGSVIEGFTIRNGDAYDGGGIYCCDSSPTISDCTITGNNSYHSGGGIYCYYHSSPTIANCTITDNIAIRGGGLYCSSDCFSMITNCTISGNMADDTGGGINVTGNSSITLTNCIVKNNSASSKGGGIYSFSNSSPTIENCTITENSAFYGGGIFSEWSSYAMTIRNCILWGDSASEGPEIGIGGKFDSIVTVGYSDVQGGEAAAYVEPDCTLSWLEGNLDLNPEFIGYGDCHLSTGSPCIDAGDPVPPYDDECFPPSLGAERNDMGAYGGHQACGWSGCRDHDGDGFFDAACGGADCYDSDPLFNPGTEEICDSIDWDCSGAPRDKDVDGDGHIDDDPRCMGDDCDDREPDTYPGAAEVCDGKDNDCDGTLPDGEEDEDADRWMICEGDCDDTAAEAHPGLIESSGSGNCHDGLDNDCDGLVDTDPECGPIRIPTDHSTIQAGIEAAADGDLVLVAPGTYVENIDFLGKDITVRSEAGAASTAIDGSQSGSVVTFLSGETEEAVIAGFTIRNGTGTFFPEDNAVYGGGICCRSSSPTITNCTVIDNHVGELWPSGGGIGCYYSSPKITNCLITRNSSSNSWEGSGGGVFFRYGLNPILENCRITKNSSENFGGGIMCAYSDMIVDGCTISENTGAKGGGIYCFICWDTPPTISNSTITNNIATDYGGGMGYYQSPVTIRNSTITGNSVVGEFTNARGGGIYCYSDSVLTMENCKVSGNSSAKYGGGIYCDGLCHPNISNCIINNNTAKEEGGGIYCTYSFSVITGCTIEGNSAENYGGGIYYHAVSHILTNCILWCDTAPEGAEIAIDSRRSILDVRYSDIQGGEAAVYVGSECTLNWQDGNIDLEPLFAGEWDYRLSLESLCIDAGDPDPAYNDACFPPSLGSERNDMGAYGGLGACGWCGDLDGDGHESVDCGGDDCFDTYAFAYPGAEEICDGFDTDCDGLVPEEEADHDEDGWKICRGDCDDEDGRINPGADEICGNGIDDDCDSLIDEPDCEMPFILEMDASYEAGHIYMYFSLGSSESSLWAGFLILTLPKVQVVPLWTIPMEVVYPPIEKPIAFPFPIVGWVAIYSGLYSEGGIQADVLAWVDTDTIQSNLPDTGIERCYDRSHVIPCPAPGEPFCGQDAQYVTNPMSFARNGDGTVTDNMTGLVWQRQDDNVKRSWDEAVEYCEDLILAEHTDWRLPDEYELQGIVDYGRKIPAIDTTYFPGTAASEYWSSSAFAYDLDFIWSVKFDFGSIRYGSKGSPGYVRCVRGESIDKSFTYNGDSTVTDNVTGLMWQLQSSVSKYTWEDALAYCEGLDLAGYSDWRLPDIKELKSIVDNTRYSPAIDLDYFPSTASFEYWSSSTFVAYYNELAWAVYFYHGDVHSHDKSLMYVRCLR